MSALSGWLSPERQVKVISTLPGLEWIEKRSNQRGRNNIRSFDGAMDIAVAIKPDVVTDWKLIKGVLKNHRDMGDFYVDNDLSKVEAVGGIVEITAHQEGWYLDSLGAPIFLFDNGLVTAAVGNITAWADGTYNNFDHRNHDPGKALGEFIYSESKTRGLRTTLDDLVIQPYGIYSCAFDTRGKRLALHLYRSVEPDNDKSPYLCWTTDEKKGVFFASMAEMLPGLSSGKPIHHLAEQSIKSFTFEN